MRRVKASLIHRRTKNFGAGRRLLGHIMLNPTVR